MKLKSIAGLFAALLFALRRHRLQQQQLHPGARGRSRPPLRWSRPRADAHSRLSGRQRDPETVGAIAPAVRDSGGGSATARVVRPVNTRRAARGCERARAARGGSGRARGALQARHAGTIMSQRLSGHDAWARSLRGRGGTTTVPATRPDRAVASASRTTARREPRLTATTMARQERRRTRSTHDQEDSWRHRRGRPAGRRRGWTRRRAGARRSARRRHHPAGRAHRHRRLGRHVRSRRRRSARTG